MIQLNISDIQHFSVGDGPGIRTTVFLKGCNLHCPWCHNPETISPKPVTLHYPKAGKSVSYGRPMTVDEVVAEVLEDADFYRQSGGGVTISGGEPLLQYEAVATLAKALQDRGISVILDTAGCVPWHYFEAVLPYVDQVFFDWKTSDSVIMTEHIGGDLSLLHANLTRLLQAGKPTHVRIPMIPDVNTEESSVRTILQDLQRAGVTTIALLPFHRLAVGKYEAMGLPYAYRDTLPPSPGEIREISLIYQELFQVYIEK